MPQTHDGNGGTITFGTSTFSGRFREIGGIREFRADIDDTDLAATDQLMRPGKLLRNDPLEIEIIWDPEDMPPVEADPESITLQYPPGAGQSTGPSRVSTTGFVIERTGPTLAQGENLIGTFSLRMNDPSEVPGT